MSLKHYGIYLAFQPTVDLRGEGLGRYIAALLKGAEEIEDVKFTIVCPSWSHRSLVELLDSEGVSCERLRIRSPNGKPYVLRVYNALQNYRKRRTKTRTLKKASNLLRKLRNKWRMRLEKNLVSAQNPTSFLLISLEIIPAILIFISIKITYLIILFSSFQIQKMLRGAWKLAKNSYLASRMITVTTILRSPKENDIVIRLFDLMYKHETKRMKKIIDCMKDVKAWYSPTAFWPEFNEISAPRLICVPDVVLSEFPTGFSNVGDDRFLSTFEAIGSSIRKADNFVTYSNAVKWGILVDRYNIDASRVSVVHHAPNTLDQWINIGDILKDGESSLNYCKNLLNGIMNRGKVDSYINGFQNTSVRFLFYASHFRPNKNIITLLRAYEYLLRKRYIGCKLLLTGNPLDMPEIQHFIIDRRLENDVICLPRLSLRELAACYRLAILAVNPSLSEGGCPFTFTEALSVGTPVVMARIPVTEEILGDKKLNDLSLFDPYDWRDMANRIEWAIKNSDTLLNIQKEAFCSLKQRTWKDVTLDHIAILDQLVTDNQKNSMNDRRQ